MIGALGVAIALAAASSAPMAVWLPGGGNTSCATWLSNNSQEHYGEGWLLGLWAGLNLKNPKGGRVGLSTDSAGIVAEVKLVCQANPSMDLLNATLQVYTKLEADGR